MSFRRFRGSKLSFLGADWSLLFLNCGPLLLHLPIFKHQLVGILRDTHFRVSLRVLDFLRGGRDVHIFIKHSLGSGSVLIHGSLEFIHQILSSICTAQSLNVLLLRIFRSVGVSLGTSTEKRIFTGGLFRLEGRLKVLTLCLSHL